MIRGWKAAYLALAAASSWLTHRGVDASQCVERQASLLATGPQVFFTLSSGLCQDILPARRILGGGPVGRWLLAPSEHPVWEYGHWVIRARALPHLFPLQ